MNKYLKRKFMNESNHDKRNPYGSKGGYVDSRGYDGNNYNQMDNRNDYNQYGSGYDSRRDYQPYNSSNDYHYQQYGQHNRPMQYEMYGVGGIMPKNDYNDGYRDGYDSAMRDSRMDSDYNFKEKEKEFKHKLREWKEKLKQKSLFNLPEQDVINQAKQMGVKFEEYNEEEFLTTYYMLMSDLKLDSINSPQAYMILAKQWLEDKDAELQGAEKLSAYYCEIVKGGKM